MRNTGGTQGTQDANRHPERTWKSARGLAYPKTLGARFWSPQGSGAYCCVVALLVRNRSPEQVRTLIQSRWRATQPGRVHA